MYMLPASVFGVLSYLLALEKSLCSLDESISVSVALRDYAILPDDPRQSTSCEECACHKSKCTAQSQTKGHSS